MACTVCNYGITKYSAWYLGRMTSKVTTLRHHHDLLVSVVTDVTALVVVVVVALLFYVHGKHL